MLNHHAGTKLRHFDSVSDLFATATDEEILTWVNRLVYMSTSRRLYARQHNTERRLLAKAARSLLDPDELQRIKDEAAQESDDHQQ